MSLSDILHHAILENEKYDLTSFYTIEPVVYSNFFNTDTSYDHVSILSVVTPSEIQNAVELQGVRSIKDLNLYSALNKTEIIKIRINLRQLLGENRSVITPDVYNNFLYMEGLDSDVNIGGANMHIKSNEIVPISYKALERCSFYIANPDQMVSVYYCRNMPKDIDRIQTVGRFRYGRGMMQVL